MMKVNGWLMEKACIVCCVVVAVPSDLPAACFLYSCGCWQSNGVICPNKDQQRAENYTELNAYRLCLGFACLWFYL